MPGLMPGIFATVQTGKNFNRSRNLQRKAKLIEELCSLLVLEPAKL